MPLGTSTHFTGTLNGGAQSIGHSISLAGWATGTSGVIVSSYATGDVSTGTSSTATGGFIGSSSGSAYISKSFTDISVKGTTGAVGNFGGDNHAYLDNSSYEPTATLQSPSFYFGYWSINDPGTPWDISSGSYPKLSWELVKITYDGNGNTGGTAPADSNTYDVGSQITLPGVGTMTKAGYTFLGWSTVSDGSGTSYDANAMLTMDANNVTLYAHWEQNPVISTLSQLLGAKQGQEYNGDLQGADGTAPYTFSITSGALPKGLTLNSDGSVVGTPQESGTFKFTVQMMDKPGITTTKNMSLQVAASPIVVAPTQLPNVLQDASYTQNFTASGGSGGYIFSVAHNSSLPEGLTLSNDGKLAGKPTVAGNHKFSVTVTDDKGQTVTKDYTLYVIPGAPLGYLTQTDVSQIVTNSGGTLQTSNGNSKVTLLVAPGTFTDPLQMDITSGTVGSGLLPSQWQLITAYGVNFSSSQTLSKPLKLTLQNPNITPTSQV